MKVDYVGLGGRIRKRRKGCFGEHLAGGVVRRGKDDGARARRDVRGEGLPRDGKAVRRRLHRNIHAAAKLDLRPVKPEGRHGHA